jgi:hypothetical protein
MNAKSYILSATLRVEADWFLIVNNIPEASYPYFEEGLSISMIKMLLDFKVMFVTDIVIECKLNFDQYNDLFFVSASRTRKTAVQIH